MKIQDNVSSPSNGVAFTVLGYTKDNCVPCCAICNYAKQGLTDEEFINHVKKNYEFLNLSNKDDKGELNGNFNNN